MTQLSLALIDPSIHKYGVKNKMTEHEYQILKKKFEEGLKKWEGDEGKQQQAKNIAQYELESAIRYLEFLDLVETPEYQQQQEERKKRAPRGPYRSKWRINDLLLELELIE